jgi:hypothetical protein
MFAKKEMHNKYDGYFYLSKIAISRKAISISFALFIVSILLLSTFAFGATSNGSNNNTISGVIGNNNDNNNKWKP